MSYDVDAIYDNGVFRPLTPLGIPDGMQVRLHVVDTAQAGDATAAMVDENGRRRAELDEFRRIMAELPVESPDDGFSGADHDRLLYGKP